MKFGHTIVENEHVQRKWKAKSRMRYIIENKMSVKSSINNINYKENNMSILRTNDISIQYRRVTELTKSWTDEDKKIDSKNKRQYRGQLRNITTTQIKEHKQEMHQIKQKVWRINGKYQLNTRNKNTNQKKRKGDTKKGNEWRMKKEKIKEMRNGIVQ